MIELLVQAKAETELEDENSLLVSRPEPPPLCANIVKEVQTTSSGNCFFESRNNADIS